jgi:hypothetical protein
MMLFFLQAAQDPFFTNDLPGFAKVVTLLVLPPISLVALWIKLGGDSKAKKNEDDITKLGSKVDLTEKMYERRFTVLETKVDKIEQQLVTLNRDIMEAIVESSKATVATIHELDKKLVVVQERTSINDAFESLGDKLADAIVEANRRNQS